MAGQEYQAFCDTVIVLLGVPGALVMNLHKNHFRNQFLIYCYSIFNTTFKLLSLLNTFIQENKINGGGLMKGPGISLQNLRIPISYLHRLKSAESQWV